MTILEGPANAGPGSEGEMTGKKMCLDCGVAEATTSNGRCGPCNGKLIRGAFAREGFKGGRKKKNPEAVAAVTPKVELPSVAEFPAPEAMCVPPGFYLDFTGREELLDRITKYADREFRSRNLQVLKWCDTLTRDRAEVPHEA